jgi:hypothetical protein
LNSNRFASIVATGTAPFTVNSSTVVSNLNAAYATIATTAINIGGGAQASIPYQTASGVTTMLAKGSAGQFLVMNTGATAPEWTSISAGVVNVSTYAPVILNGTPSEPIISMNVANGATNGYLSAADWTTFNNKSAAFTTSAGLRSLLSDESGTGAALFQNGNIGAATCTTLNGLTITTTSGTLTISSNYTLTVAGTASVSGTNTGDTASIAASIVNGDTTHAPSGDAVYDALALKANLASPALTGNVTIGGAAQSGYELTVHDDIYAHGDIYAAGTVYSNSDITMKNIFGVVPDVLSFYDYIELIEYAFKADDLQQHKYGYSAQNLNEMWPLVSIHKENDTYEIDHLGISALNTKAIKELKAENESLKARLEILENIILNK